MWICLLFILEGVDLSMLDTQNTIFSSNKDFSMYKNQMWNYN